MEEDFLIEVFNDQELEQLNDKEPRLGHQERFAKKLKSKSTRGNHYNKKPFPFMRIAAAIALLVSVYSVGTLSRPDETQLEIASFTQYFNSLLEEKTSTLEEYTSQKERFVILDALTEIKDLEADAQLLIEDLNNGGDSKQIIKAMTDNYNARLKVLDQLTIDLNELKQ